MADETCAGFRPEPDVQTQARALRDEELGMMLGMVVITTIPPELTMAKALVEEAARRLRKET